MKWVANALIAGAFFVASTASGFAQVPPWIPNGLYVRGDVGGAFGNNATFTDSSPTAANCDLCTGSLPASIGNSVLFGGGIGYRFNSMLRTDLTIDYIPSFKIKGTAVGGGPLVAGATASADLRSLVALVNGYLDLNGFMPNTFGPFQPYLDVGVGLARNSVGTINGDIPPGFGSLPYTLSGAARTNFAFGGGAGVGYALTPNLTLDLSYKFLNIGEADAGNTRTIAGFAPTIVTTDKSDDLTAHTVVLSIRYAFAAPPPPPAPTPVVAPPAPPPAPPVAAKQVFIVFFEFDKSVLTADGGKVVDAAAAAFKSGKSGVAVAGYTDLAGTQQYNLALSHRRAETVKAALVKDGVPAAAIDESWFGKQNPRVPTAEGVREPQNRRVEIAM